MGYATVLKANPYHDDIGRFSDHAGAKFVSLWGKRNVVATNDTLRPEMVTPPIPAKVAPQPIAPPEEKPELKNRALGVLEPAVVDRQYEELAHNSEAFTDFHRQQVSRLTPLELRAVEQYTSEYYRDVNNPLREGRELGETAQKIKKNLDSALKKSIAGKDITVTRGLEVTAALRPLMEGGIKNLVGKVFTDKGYSSTTTKKSDFVFDGDMRLVIQVGKEKNALYVSSASENSGEREVLLPRNAKFVIKKVEDTKSGSRKVRVFHMVLL